MSDYIETYHYSARSKGFSFILRKMWDNEVRIYISNSPSYSPRSTCMHATHRLSDSQGYYVCVRDDLIPKTISDAKSWARYWADKTAKYIDCGTSFS